MVITTQTLLPAPSENLSSLDPPIKQPSTPPGGLGKPRNHQEMSSMNATRRLRNRPRLAALTLLIGLIVASAAAPAVGAGLPPAFGKLCGHVSGAAWKYSGQSGTEYNVTARPASSCRIAMRSVSGLTKQKPHFGALGAQTLVGPRGYRCSGAGALHAHGGFCGHGASHFMWAPRKRTR
jgi:hypothetical protein